MNYFLAGDVGGTNTRLSIGTVGGEFFQHTYHNAAYLGLADMLGDFLLRARLDSVDAACFAVAAPISGKRVKLTNLPWIVDADEIAAHFKIPRVILINDFEAVGHGIAALAPDDLLTLQQGVEVPQGVKLAAGAGTGLGVAWITRSGEEYTVHSSEGGHMDFAPQNSEQIELLGHMQKRYPHVSTERLVSGPGLIAIFDFLRSRGDAAASPELLQATGMGDASAITRAAEMHEPIAEATLRLFVEIYGAFAGNLALLTLPSGGVYLAGGIAAKIAPFMQKDFIRAFRAKGRYEGFMDTLPVHIVLHPDVGLLGAERIARGS
jgi:glucokinase